jgi:hypothetical protein
VIRPQCDSDFLNRQEMAPPVRDYLYLIVYLVKVTFAKSGTEVPRYR